jgi:hypothetical protein
MARIHWGALRRRRRPSSTWPSTGTSSTASPTA